MRYKVQDFVNLIAKCPEMSSEKLQKYTESMELFHTLANEYYQVDVFNIERVTMLLQFLTDEGENFTCFKGYDLMNAIEELKSDYDFKLDIDMF